MAALLLALLLTQAPPKPSELARIAYGQGDLVTAMEYARKGIKTDKACKPMIKDLIEYQSLAGHTDALTVDEAKLLLALDKKISPGRRGKITDEVYLRRVQGPINRARMLWQNGGPGEALQALQLALEIDPANADALQMQAALKSDAGYPVADAGVPDAGVKLRK